MIGRPRRPAGVTILLWLVLSLTAWSTLRLIAAFRWWSVLQEFEVGPGPLYIALTAGFWWIASLVLLWGLWRKSKWIRASLIAAAIGYSAWYWLDRLLFQDPRQNSPFSLGATALLLVTVMICIVHPRTIKFLSQRESNDR